MKTRVHYIDPQGRPKSKDIAASKEDAPRVFVHLYPGCKAARVEVIGGPRKVREDATAPLPFAAPASVTVVAEERPRPLLDFASLRARLRALPAPVSRPGRVETPSLEQRHGTTQR